MKFDLHIHTFYSKYGFNRFDSIIRPRELIKIALKRNLDGVAITDHNTTKGINPCLKENRSLDNKLQIIPGCEISSKEGHILALGIKKWGEKKHLPAVDVVEKIKDLGGIAVGAHPYMISFTEKCLHDSVKDINLDGIEVLNFRCLKSANRKAMVAATKLKLGRTAGSDAHVALNVGKAVTICEGDVIDSILKNRTRVKGEEAGIFRIIGEYSYRLFFNLLDPVTKELS
jgi:predicted metal-dependent phosphoesterase TrpH